MEIGISKIFFNQAFRVHCKWTNGELTETDFVKIFSYWEENENYKMLILKNLDIFNKITIGTNNNLQWNIENYSNNEILVNEILEISNETLIKFSNKLNRIKSIKSTIIILTNKDDSELFGTKKITLKNEPNKSKEKNIKPNQT